MNLRIKELRKNKNMTQEELATRIGLSRNFITQIETGKKNPSPRTVTALCREFGVNENWLRFGTGKKSIEAQNDAALAVSELMDKSNPLYDSVLKIMISYQKLDEDSRSVIDHLINVLVSKRNEKQDSIDVPNNVQNSLSIDEKVAIYRQKLEREENLKKPK